MRDECPSDAGGCGVLACLVVPAGRLAGNPVIRVRLAGLVVLTWLAEDRCWYWQGGKNPFRRKPKH